MTPHSLRALLADGRDPATPVTPDRCWGQLRADAAGLSLRLQAQGIRRGALWCKDGYAFAVGLLGMAQSACAVVLPPHVQPGFLAECGDAWDAIVSDELDGAVPPLAEPSANPMTPTDTPCRVEFFTSGTTGRVKRVVRSLDLLEREAAALEAVWGGAGLGVTHATVTHQHAYGLPFKILWPLLTGRPFAPRSHDVWESLPDTPGLVIISSPAHLTRLGGLPPRHAAALVFSAGAPLPEAAALDANRILGTTPVEIFGSTETGAMAHRSGNAAWRPLPGNTVGGDAEGRLELRSPWVDGPHRGDDAVAMNPDGSFVLRGRLDRLVKIGGKRISLAEVEAALLALPEIADAAVAQIGDDLAAAVVPSAAGADELAAMGAFRLGRRLRARLAVRLEPMARPRRWRFVAAIPTGAMGKRAAAAIARLFEEPGDV